MNKLEISWTSLWKILLMIVFGVALYLLRDVLIILALALVISSALDAPISFLERKKIPRILGTILIFLTGAAVLTLLLYAIVPAAIMEFKNLSDILSKYQLKLPAVQVFNSLDFIKNIGVYLGNFANTLLSGGISFIGVISAIFGSAVFLTAVFVLSFYLSASKYGVEKFLRAVLPSSQEEYVMKIYFRARRKIGLWLQGQLILSLIIGLAVFFGLLILGVKYSLILGILAGILEMVPYVGPVLVGIISFLLVISQSLTLGFSVAALFVIIKQVANHLLVPLVMRYTTGLHPVVVVISLLAGAQLFGFAGIILAVPAAVVIQEIIEDWAIQKKSVK